MRECAKSLRPDHTEVSNTSKIDLGKDSIEDVSEQVEAHSRHHRLSTRVARVSDEMESVSTNFLPADCPNSQLVGNVTETKRNGDLQEQTHGRQRIARQSSEAKTVDDRGRVRVESSLGSVVAKGNQEVDPEPPVAKLPSMRARQPSTINSRILRLTAFLNDAKPICFFFLPFMGSSMTTRDLRICSSRSVKKLVLGKNVLLGFLNESGKNKPRTTPLAMVNAPIRANNQNHPGLPPTPRICRIP